MKLSKEFYLQDDVASVGKQLIGKLLVSNIDGIVTAGKIVETEAYAGVKDKASHSYGGRRTNRTEIMFAEGGISYVYLCYGIYHLFNVVSNRKDSPDAVLIRALEPIHGVEYMLRRRGLAKVQRNVAGGPGLASQALGLTTLHNGLPLTGDTVWIEDAGQSYTDADLIISPRVGVGYAEDHALWPMRFRLKGSAFTSPAK